jgi:modified peptide precursor CbpA
MKKAKNSRKKKVIAHRKKCKSTGAGLSHYILMEKR